ncbi:histidine kinase [Thiosulfatimonas sediminis]|uniref:histidine kinase n=1 Tax=Thiosulfatimonas sediminis TaxID=2675054 RepID=A0A6F8PT93_9GAMM|nr:ATP-binding protein [Thiosulfatimonas sediminis]BBP45353.1 histidine kinase [Thiosulfatimonas sediminis]
MLRIQIPQPAQIRYYTSMLLFLSIIWLVTLGWFIGHLKMQFSLAWSSVWLLLLLLTLSSSFLLSRNKRLSKGRSTNQNCRKDNWLWMSLLMWAMLINSALLYATGGTINPLTHLLLLPLALGMLLLSPPFFMSLAVFSALLYLLLNYYYVPIMSLKVQSLQAFFAWHLHGSMLVFMLLVLFLALFILPMKSRLDQQQRLLETQQRSALETEYVLSVASIASASAHQLSTPLNTLTFLHDLLQSEVHSDTGKDYLKTMQEQLIVCTQALQNLRLRADYANKNQPPNIPLSQFFKTLKQEFALLHPRSSLQIQGASNALESYTISADPSLKLALMNLLDNGARYSPEWIELQWQLNETAKPCELHLQIRDQGGGLNADLLDNLGKAPAESPHGLGMGVFLSRMILNRFHGDIQFANDTDSAQKIRGLKVTIWLSDILQKVPTTSE